MTFFRLFFLFVVVAFFIITVYINSYIFPFYNSRRLHRRYFNRKLIIELFVFKACVINFSDTTISADKEKFPVD